MPAFSIMSFIVIENGLVTAKMDVNTIGASSVDSGSFIAKQDKGWEQTK